MERTFLPLDHQGGVVQTTLENGKVRIVINGKNNDYTIAKTCALKEMGMSASFIPDEYALLYTPTYVCVVNVNDVVKSKLATMRKNLAWTTALEAEKKKYVMRGYADLLIPIPRKIGQTNKCYIVEGNVGINKKEYNAMVGANRKIINHFEALRSQFK